MYKKTITYRKQFDLYGRIYPIRPERAEALSPGQRPGLLWTQGCRPVRAKALKLPGKYIKLLPLQGALPIAIIPRALPWAKSFCPFRACCWRASAFYLSLRPVTVGSGRAVGELLDLLGVPTVQVETYCCIQVIIHYCLGN